MNVNFEASMAQLSTAVGRLLIASYAQGESQCAYCKIAGFDKVEMEVALI